MELPAFPSIIEVARELGYSAKHVRALIDAGKLKAVAGGLGTQRKSWRVPRAELERFMREGTGEGSAQLPSLPPPPPAVARRNRGDRIVPRFTAPL
jgi:excisionase family DNA binding protein